MSDPETEHISALRATAHPLRLRILSLLTGAQMSAAEVARELDLTHANASYHLRVLASAGMLVEAGEERIRGGVAKRYRHPWEQTELPPGASPADRELYVRAVADELVRRFAVRRPNRKKNLVTDAEVWVEPPVWDQVVTLVRQASDLVHAQAKPPRAPGTIHVNMTAAVFQMDDR